MKDPVNPNPNPNPYRALTLTLTLTLIRGSRQRQFTYCIGPVLVAGRCPHPKPSPDSLMAPHDSHTVLAPYWRQVGVLTLNLIGPVLAAGRRHHPKPSPDSLMAPHGSTVFHIPIPSYRRGGSPYGRLENNPNTIRPNPSKSVVEGVASRTTLTLALALTPSPTL